MASNYKHNEYDLLKVISTLLVVIGHITIRYSNLSTLDINSNIFRIITKCIYLFHMPLFMTISGAIYSINKNKQSYKHFKEFSLNKAKRLLIPYYCIGFIFLIPTILIIDKTNGDIITWQNITYKYIQFIIGYDCKHLWYLLALFEIFIIHFWLKKIQINNYQLLLISVIISILNSIYGSVNIFCLNMTIFYYPYFILGSILQSNENRNNIYIGCAGTIVSSIILVLFDNRITDSIFSIALPIFIIVAIVELTRIIYKYCNHNKKNIFYNIILKDTFAIYLFHVIIIYLLDNYIDISLSIKLPVLFVTSIVIPIIIAYIIRKVKIQFIIGEDVNK